MTADGRRALPTTIVGDEVMVSLDDLAAIFQLSVREDTLAGGVTVTHEGKSVILTPGQALASAAGRIVSLPCPPSRYGHRWLVPVEFISRALSVIYKARLDVRKGSRLVLVGSVRVPRVAVREDVLAGQPRVTLTITPRTPYTITQEAGRVLVRFDADALDLSLPAASPRGPLPGVRAGDTGAEVAIDTGPRVGSYRASFVPQENGGQLTIDLLAPAPEAAPLPGPATVPPPAAALPRAPSACQPAAGGLRVIVIDPGHGGADTGVRGAAGTLEKDVTLALARRLATLIENRLGVRVVLTRNSDQAMTDDDRAALANNNMGDLFLSLHANASVRKSVSGAEVYYLSTAPAGNMLGRAEAGRQALPTLGGGSRTIEMIPWELAQLRHVDRSKTLAESLQERFSGRMPTSARAVQAAPLRVLAGVNMPAVLIEVGFLTNPDEEQKLASAAYQATVAEAVLDGVLLFSDRAGQADARQEQPSAPEPARRLP